MPIKANRDKQRSECSCLNGGGLHRAQAGVARRSIERSRLPRSHGRFLTFEGEGPAARQSTINEQPPRAVRHSNLSPPDRRSSGT
jgi:hypothetical protein